MSKVRANVFGLLYQALPAWALALLAVISGALFTAALTTAAYSFSKQQLRQRFELLAAEAGCTLWHGYLTDVSEPKRVEHELRALSITDVLTGIHNRRYFQERLKIELDRAARDGLELAVIMLDVDHFKRINDQHGHAVGDDVLRSLCQHISHRLRRTDVFCRLGGEEFMVLCPGSDIAQARTLALELWQGVRSLVINGVGEVTASFGVAAWHPGEGADALLLRADAGVYAAKQGGRDRVEVVQP